MGDKEHRTAALMERGLRLAQSYRRTRANPDTGDWMYLFLGRQIDGPGWSDEQRRKATEQAIRERFDEDELTAIAMEELGIVKHRPDAVVLRTWEEVADLAKNPNFKPGPITINFYGIQI